MSARVVGVLRPCILSKRNTRNNFSTFIGYTGQWPVRIARIHGEAGRPEALAPEAGRRGTRNTAVKLWRLDTVATSCSVSVPEWMCCPLTERARRASHVER